MTVKEMIDKLKVYPENCPVVVTVEVHAMGSSGTGIYGTGELDLHKIESVVFRRADILGSFGDLEQLDRVEIAIEEDNS